MPHSILMYLILRYYLDKVSELCVVNHIVNDGYPAVYIVDISLPTECYKNVIAHDHSTDLGYKCSYKTGDG